MDSFYMVAAMFYHTDVCITGFDCGVCYLVASEDAPMTSVLLPCGHTLCLECLRGLCQYNRLACPHCRGSADSLHEFARVIEDS